MDDYIYIKCRVVESTGPTNTRKYTVAVYFRGERLASGVGHSIQQAEMAAATNALNDKAGRVYYSVLCTRNHGWWSSE